MRILKQFLFFILFLIPELIYAQTSFIDKDLRIINARNSIVKLLLKDQEFGDPGKHNLNYFYNEIYITKEIELFHNNLLLIRFGSLSPHGQNYWGILQKNKTFLFHYSSNGKDSHDDLLNYLNKSEINTRKTILDYLARYAQDEYNGIEIIDEKDTTRLHK
jgi:hypothetical protein